MSIPIPGPQGLHSRHEAGPQLFLLLVAHSLGEAEPEGLVVGEPQTNVERWGERLETDGGGIGKFNLRLHAQKKIETNIHGHARV